MPGRLSPGRIREMRPTPPIRQTRTFYVDLAGYILPNGGPRGDIGLKGTRWNPYLIRVLEIVAIFLLCLGAEPDGWDQRKGHIEPLSLLSTTWMSITPVLSFLYTYTPYAGVKGFLVCFHMSA